MKNANFDFKAAGYESPGDWSRLWDRVPKLSVDTPAGDPRRVAHAAYEKGKRTKPLLLALLRTYGIKPEPYNAEATRVRNVA